MKFKAIAACCYFGLVYFAAGRVEGLHPLFFPALGAFAYLLIVRQSPLREMLNVTVGAIACSFIGSLLAMLHPSTVFLVVDALIVFWLIHKRGWNAPLIVAVSFIPFFSGTSNWWAYPLCNGAALLGLILTLAGASVAAKHPAVRTIRAFGLRDPNA